MTLLCTHTVYRGLAWSLGIVALTLVFGRVFCGWICPFGTLHHFFGWIFPSALSARRQARRREHARTGGSAGKYYLMLAFLAAAVAGSAIGGLFDPICVAVRAIGLGVVPALQYLGIRSATVAAETNLRVGADERGRPAGLARAERLDAEPGLLPPDLVHRSSCWSRFCS